MKGRKRGKISLTRADALSLLRRKFEGKYDAKRVEEEEIRRKKNEKSLRGGKRSERKERRKNNLDQTRRVIFVKEEKGIGIRDRGGKGGRKEPEEN